MTDFDLKYSLIDALNVHAAEMDNITLDCHVGNANDVTWLHDNQRVLHYKKDGSINPGKGYEGRVSLEKNCFKTGDFSLTITGVRKTDAGIYRCFVDDEMTEGYPHTYYLSHVNGKTGKGDSNLIFNLHHMVNNNLVNFAPDFHSKKAICSLIHTAKRSSPEDQTDSNCNEEQTLLIYKCLTIIFVIISIILLLVIVIPKLNCQSTSATAIYHVPKSDENDYELSNTTSPKNDSQSMVNHPVQESDTTENKPSNTKPF